MSVASSPGVAHRRPGTVVRALIEEARRRARRRRVALFLAAAGVAVALLLFSRGNPLTGSAHAATPTVLRTNWTERVDFKYANGSRSSFLRLYVRRIELTRTSWKAAVGVGNASGIAVRFASGLDQPDPDLPFTYWAGPGIWWSRYVSGGTWQPGTGTVVTHAVRASVVRPAVPARLGAKKSWFGTFSGSLAGVPRDRLLRIGFGLFFDPGTFECAQMGTACVNRKVPISTTHQFKLPKRL
jgi:hypothetical protein